MRTVAARARFLHIEKISCLRYSGLQRNVQSFHSDALSTVGGPSAAALMAGLSARDYGGGLATKGRLPLPKGCLALVDFMSRTIVMSDVHQGGKGARPKMFR